MAGQFISLKPMWLRVVLCTFVIAVAIYFAIPPVHYRLYIKPGKDQKLRDSQTFISKYIADQKYISSTYLPTSAGTKRDAGLFLNNKIPWLDYGANEAVQKPLSLSPTLLANLKEWKGRWPQMASSVPWQQLDFSWMGSLQEYDHWDIHKECQGCVHSEIRTRGFLRYLAPDFKHLMGWTRLRLLHGLQTKDVLRASADVRQLAHLIMSQESLVSAMVAQLIFKQERVAYDHAMQNNMPVDPRWHPLNLEELERAKRVCLTTGAMFNAQTPNQVLLQVFAADAKYYCKCVGLAEGIFTGAILGSSLRAVVDRKKERVMTNIVGSARDCRLKPWRTEWKRVEFVGSKDVELSINQLPWPLQKMWGDILTSYAPDPWLLYKSEQSEDSKAQPAH